MSNTARDHYVSGLGGQGPLEIPAQLWPRTGDLCSD